MPNSKEITTRLNDAENMRRCRLDVCQAACCYDGVWVDVEKAKLIRQNADLIIPFMPAGQNRGDVWFLNEREGDPHLPGGEVIHTAVLPNDEHPFGASCIFLREDHKCALQTAGEAAGLHPWHFKPFYCILHPLDLDDDGRITLDKTSLLLEDPRSCLRPTQQQAPLRELFAEELAHLAQGQSAGDAGD
ncbi:MAG: hypothetical protein OEY93_10695 [Anaerolineae bacterium]|nr:hypothetical protein [Anaerolineae bacterium]